MNLAEARGLIAERRNETEILAGGLNTSVWARVTGRDEVEVALNTNPSGKPRGNGQSFLYLSPNGKWRTNGLHLLEHADRDTKPVNEGYTGAQQYAVEEALNVLDVINEAYGDREVDMPKALARQMEKAVRELARTGVDW